MREQRIHPTGDQVASRVATCIDEQQEEEVEVDEVELVVVDRRRGDQRGQIVRRLGALALPHLRARS